MHSSLSLTTFLAVALGGFGVYLMLPRGTASSGKVSRITGAILATISLVLITSFFGERLESISEAATFYMLAALSIASAVMTISSRNPVFSALWFALLLLSNSGLYLYQGAEFLAASTVIIYAGAIIVTFLFVMMLAQPQGTASYDRHAREPMLSCIAGIILAGTLVGTLSDVTRQEMRIETAQPGGSSVPSKKAVEQVLAQGSPTAIIAVPVNVEKAEAGTPSESTTTATETPVAVEHVDQLGKTLFLDHFVSVEVVAMLLLVAVIGAVLIATGGAPEKLSTEKQG